MPYAPFSDEDIIRLLQSSDRLQENEAVKWMWQKYQRLVKDLVYIYGGKPDEESLVLHEATVAVVLNVQQGIYDPAKSALSTYFRAIAINTLIKMLRERGKGKVIPLGDLPPDFPKFAENETEKTLELKEMEEKMRAAIGRLDVTCQQVLMQYYYEEKSMREIAQALGKNEVAVRQWRHRCYGKLWKMLGDDFKNWHNDK